MTSTSHEIALNFAEKFQKEYPNTPIHELMEELRQAIDDHVEQVKSVGLGGVGGNEVALPDDDDVNTDSALNMGRTLDMGKQ